MIGDLIAGLLGKVLDRAWPDPAQKAAAAQAIAELQRAGEFKRLDVELAQLQRRQAARAWPLTATRGDLRPATPQLPAGLREMQALSHTGRLYIHSWPESTLP